jgi:hypothetical protein
MSQLSLNRLPPLYTPNMIHSMSHVSMSRSNQANIHTGQTEHRQFIMPMSQSPKASKRLFLASKTTQKCNVPTVPMVQPPQPGQPHAPQTNYSKQIVSQPEQLSRVSLLSLPSKHCSRLTPHFKGLHATIPTSQVVSLQQINGMCIACPGYLNVPSVKPTGRHSQRKRKTYVTNVPTVPNVQPTRHLYISKPKKITSMSRMSPASRSDKQVKGENERIYVECHRLRGRLPISRKWENDVQSI